MDRFDALSFLSKLFLDLFSNVTEKGDDYCKNYGIWCMETTFDVFVTNTPALFFIYWLFTTVLYVLMRLKFVLWIEVLCNFCLHNLVRKN